jgi:hypothetical protein
MIIRGRLLLPDLQSLSIKSSVSNISLPVGLYFHLDE